MLHFFSSMRTRKINSWVVFYAVIYIIVIIKVTTFQHLDNNLLFAVYSIIVSIYILSKFAISSLHKHHPDHFDKSYEPTISFGIPSKNEGGNIYETIIRIARSNYPKNKMDIIAINDGSTDNTLTEMYRAQKDVKELGVDVKVIDWRTNLGKRAGMAECVRQSIKDIIIFIDSDSFITPETTHHLIKYFTDKKVAAVAGHAFVANADKNLITKMQAVRYFVAFKAYKGTESVFGSVTCCSGCCSAYRREYLAPILEEWLQQKFLGITCTYGDDRSLTNFLLRKGYKALYSENAKAYTFAPDTLRQFMKQQLRWKKSWVRESFIASKFMWKKHPVMSISFYLGVILPLLAPIIVLRALIWYPISTGHFPWFYILGLLLMALIYGLYYHVYIKDNRWLYGTLFAVFYTLILLWQLPWAILNLRDSRWGTR